MPRTIDIEGQKVPATEVEPLLANEKWSEYQMPNGDLVKVKLVATRIFYAEGHKNKMGEPIYTLDFQPIVKAVAGKE